MVVINIHKKQILPLQYLLFPFKMIHSICLILIQNYIRNAPLISQSVYSAPLTG